jgi:hypothetical protein
VNYVLYVTACVVLASLCFVGSLIFAAALFPLSINKVSGF